MTTAQIVGCALIAGSAALCLYVAWGLRRLAVAAGDNPARRAEIDASGLVRWSSELSASVCHVVPDSRDGDVPTGSDERSRRLAAHLIGCAPDDLWWAPMMSLWVRHAGSPWRRRADPRPPACAEATADRPATVTPEQSEWIASQDPADRLALMLHYADGLTPAEIAAMLDIPASEAKRRLTAIQRAFEARFGQPATQEPTHA